MLYSHTLSSRARYLETRGLAIAGDAGLDVRFELGDTLAGILLPGRYGFTELPPFRVAEGAELRQKQLKLIVHV